MSSTMYEGSLRKLKGPGIGLLSIGVLGLLGQLVSGILFAVRGAEGMRDDMREVMDNISSGLSDSDIERLTNLAPQLHVIQLLVGALGSLLLIAGGWNMLRLKAYEVCFAACIVALLPICTPCCGCIPLCLPGAAIGIWGMVVLFDDEVRDAFKGVPPRAASAHVATVVSQAAQPWAPPTPMPPPAPPPQQQDWNRPPPPPPAS
jgi:hypothetical protein